ncbi:MAG TPA: CoB--CoM heterodisulfide reductase iron-sulfur subunit A family protein [Anaerolineae bacterium]|nr:CoB--CoM heterodisulfide reductase iron-sulfur subunit A family protein [Anaerolineae bacterium]
MSNRSVVVVGGGIAGIQASIDLANMGLQVYLVEQSPSIGGRMAQLDKTFPTNDCSMCILAPKMIECAGHENVHLLTYSELAGIDGEAGDFRVTVRRKPRYVDVSKCTGCGECAEKCPRRVPDEFNVGLDKRKAIYLPFPQAVPRKMTIDAGACLYLSKGRCRVCQETCQAGAIDFEQQEEVVELAAGAIVLATGFDPFDPRSLKEYGYGEIENVITGLEYERLICASGPTGGHLERPSDGQVPEIIAFIQCVGSRDVNYQPYCSSVCCMHATKEAILANEHYPDLKSVIFYTDMRAVGKQFQEYIIRAKEEYGVSYLRSRPGKITVNGETGNPLVWYDETVYSEAGDPERRVASMEVNLVVLCQALVPHSVHEEMASKLGLELDGSGFVAVEDRLLRPVDTSVPGIFACGFCQEPQDIPDSVVQASAAAARVAEILSLASKELEHA